MHKHRKTSLCFFAVLCLLFVTAALHAQGPELLPLADGKGQFHFLAAHPAHDPLTVQARFILEDLSDLEAVWIGLSDSPDAAPSLLSIVWAEDRSAWFPVWALHLQTDANLFGPGVNAKNGTGLLAGSQVVSLQNVRPAVGHSYEAELSYDPVQGIVAVGLSDLTEGTRLFTREVPINAPATPLYPVIGVAGGTVTVESVAAYDASVPLGAAWDLMVRDGERYSRLALYRLTPDVELALNIETRGDYAGQFTVEVHSDAVTHTLVELPASGRTEGRLVPIKAADLPLGPITLEIAYVDEASRKWSLGNRSFLNVAATLEISYDDLQVVDDAVTGLLTVVSIDEHVEDLEVRLSAQVAPVDGEGARLPVLATVLEQVGKTPVRIPFAVSLPAEGSLFSLDLEVEFGTPVGIVSSPSQFHVLRVAAN